MFVLMMLCHFHAAANVTEYDPTPPTSDDFKIDDWVEFQNSLSDSNCWNLNRFRDESPDEFQKFRKLYDQTGAKYSTLRQQKWCDMIMIKDDDEAPIFVGHYDEIRAPKPPSPPSQGRSGGNSSESQGNTPSPRSMPRRTPSPVANTDSTSVSQRDSPPRTGARPPNRGRANSTETDLTPLQRLAQQRYEEGKRSIHSRSKTRPRRHTFSGNPFERAHQNSSSSQRRGTKGTAGYHNQIADLDALRERFDAIKKACGQ